jgi:hypothetical protein
MALTGTITMAWLNRRTIAGSIKMLTFLAIVTASSLAVVACESAGASSRTVSRTDFGEEWPLTVDSGVLSCEGAGSVYFTSRDGKRYAVNGTAMTAGDAEQIDPIWEEDPRGLSPKKNIGPLIDEGLKLCEV